LGSDFTFTGQRVKDFSQASPSVESLSRTLAETFPGDYGVDDRIADMEAGSPKSGNRIRNLKKPTGMACFKDVESPNRCDATFLGGKTTAPLVDQNRGYSQFESQRNCLGLTWVQTPLGMNLQRLPYDNPIGQLPEPRCDRLRSVGVTKLGKDSRRDQHLSKKLREDINRANLTHVIDGRRVGNDGCHTERRWSNTEEPRSNSSMVSEIAACFRFKNSSVS